MSGCERSQVNYEKPKPADRWVFDCTGNEMVSSPQIMYHFLIEFLELAVSCLGLGEGGCDCTALATY